MNKEELQKKNEIRLGRRQGPLERLVLTPEKIKEVNRRDAERIKALEENREWQIKTYGYYDPGAADY